MRQQISVKLLNTKFHENLCNCSQAVTGKEEGLANMPEVKTMATRKYVQYMPLSPIVIDYKMFS